MWAAKKPKTKNLPAMLPTASQKLQQPERGGVLLEPLCLVASKQLVFLWLNPTHAMLYLPLAISITTKRKQKGAAIISTRIQISFQNEKPVIIPQELIFEAEGQTWLKLRPTAQPIVQLIHGGATGCSFSSNSDTR